MMRFILGLVFGFITAWCLIILTTPPPIPLKEMLPLMKIECSECDKMVSYTEYGAFGGLCMECYEHFQSLQPKASEK